MKKEERPKRSKMKTAGSGQFDLINGIPMAEYREVRVGNCLRCQRDPEEAGRGVIIGMWADQADVLNAETVCFDCLSPEEREEYQDVINA